MARSKKLTVKETFDKVGQDTLAHFCFATLTEEEHVYSMHGDVNEISGGLANILANLCKAVGGDLNIINKICVAAVDLCIGKHIPENVPVQGGQQ